jgi:DNA-binding response OmpR family regulator
MTIDEAQRIVLKTTIDLIVAEPAAAGDSGLSFVRWLRRSELDPNATTPVIMVSANLSKAAIRNARDAGANFCLAKPMSPKILMERISWVIRDNRQFVISDTFSGPDRRFKAEGPPPGVQPRRKTDLKSKLGEAVDANMSQSEIDTLLKPQKVVLT